MDPFCYLCFVCYAVMFVHFSLVVTCWKRTHLLALLYVMYSCVLLLLRVVSWVRCGTGLYRFLIFAVFLTVMLTLLLPMPLLFSHC